LYICPDFKDLPYALFVAVPGAVDLYSMFSGKEIPAAP
jgi:hypothetical protein